MKTGKLLIKNFDAQISKIEIIPRSADSEITIHSKMYDEPGGGKIPVKILFDRAAAIEFHINFFDNTTGSEACGLYEITDSDFIDSIARRNFERRKEIFLLEGDYAHDPDGPADMLNAFDRFGIYRNERESFRAFVQNVDAGVYIIIAGGYRVLR